MKRMSIFLLVCLGFFLCINNASADPLDLSTFFAEDGVVVSGGEVTFTEDLYDVAWYFYDDYFLVPDNATMLSFNYDFNLGEDDEYDFFTFDLNFSPVNIVTTDTSNGYYEVDLSSYQNSEISLAWGLVWGGDFPAGTTASIYNIDLATTSGTDPVPEPATMILLGSGLVGLLGMGKKKFFKKS